MGMTNFAKKKFENLDRTIFAKLLTAKIDTRKGTMQWIFNSVSHFVIYQILILLFTDPFFNKTFFNLPIAPALIKTGVYKQ